MTNVNPNTHIPHGDDPSVSDATGSVGITEADKSALAETSVEKENKTPTTEMIDSDIHNSQGVDALRSDVASPMVNQASDGTVQPQTNDPCPCGSGKKFGECCDLGQECAGMTREFLVIYDSKGRVMGHLMPDPTPSVEWVRNQAIDFITRYPDYSGVIALKVKYNLDTRKVLRAWPFDPATETWRDVDDASAIRWVQNLFDANQQVEIYCFNNRTRDYIYFCILRPSRINYAVRAFETRCELEHEDVIHVDRMWYVVSTGQLVGMECLNREQRCWESAEPKHLEEMQEFLDAPDLRDELCKISENMRNAPPPPRGEVRICDSKMTPRG